MVIGMPTVAEISADPSKIAKLPGKTAAAIGAVFASLATSCAMRAIIDRAEPVAAESLGTLSVDEAAAMLGIQSSTLRHRAKRAPYAELRIDNGTRRLRFSATKMRIFLELPAWAASPLPDPICVYLSELPPATGIPAALAEYADRLVSLPTEPPMCGVYFLLVDDVIKYIGSTGNVRSRLAAHWSDGKRWNRALFMSTMPEERLRVEYGFIGALKPEWNRTAYKIEDTDVVPA